MPGLAAEIEPPSARPSPACAASATPGPRSAPGSASPARPPSNAGAAPHDRRDSRPRSRTHHPARDRGRPPTTPHLPADFRRWERELAADRRLLAPDPAPRPHRHHRPGHRRTRPRLRHRRRAGGCCTSPAATAARPSARPARRSTSATPASSSARAWPAARASPRPITAHPCVFATLTAPSFGPVHARRMRGKTVLPCRPRRDANARRCPHGRDISCPTRHAEDDPRLGQPMCPDCYDYEAAVLFNAYAADLWRRFTTYLPRHLARLAGRHPASRCAPWSASGTSRSPNTRPAASSTSTP